MNIVRRELVIPFELAGLRIQRQNAIGIEVVALALVAIEIGTRIAHRPINRVELRIVSAGHPGRAAPCIHEFPFHVSEPGSPGFGTVQKRQTSLPVD